MSLRHSQTVELRSSTAQIVAGEMFRCGAKTEVHILTAPADLMNIEGCAGPNPAEFNTLLVKIAGGDVAAANLGPGHYVVVGGPNWIRLTVGLDGAGPQSYRNNIVFKPED